MELRRVVKPPYGEGELSSQGGSAAKSPTTSNQDGHQEHGISPARYKAAAQTEVSKSMFLGPYSVKVTCSLRSVHLQV